MRMTLWWDSVWSSNNEGQTRGIVPRSLEEEDNAHGEGLRGRGTTQDDAKVYYELVLANCKWLQLAWLRLQAGN
jgi:hypothetical protein